MAIAWSRREFSTLAAAGISARLARAQGQLTAGQAVERIRQNLGVPWREETVDTFKAGDPDTPVRGIATSVMSTLDVLQRASKAGLNLVISHEPTFYNHADETEHLEEDPVYRRKQDFIRENNLVVWRFHDHWHRPDPDPMAAGLAGAMGWAGREAGNERRYKLPPTTLKQLASQIQRRMNIQTMRVIGDPSTKVSSAALSPGASGFQATLRNLPEVDVIVLGEVREWEGVEYAHDTVAAGFAKGMILLGHAVSEDPGMEKCAEWLKTFLPDLPIEFIPAGEPFWNPAVG